MADEDTEKTGDDPVTEEEHEPTPDPEPEHDEGEFSEEECDEAIGQLLAELERLQSENAALRERIDTHEREFEHVARRVEPEPGIDAGTAPEERHWYFKPIRH